MSNLKPLHPHELLSWMAIPSYPGVYILGSFARHVTIYSQQMRAFNLIDALCKTGQLRPKTKVAVVGGGVAGLTAAAAAAVRGADVTLIESDKDFFPIQRNAGNRYLHPHIYDWPLFEAETDLANVANFPFLGWEADDADKVFRKLKEEWESLFKGCPKLRPKTLMETSMKGLHRGRGWILETDAPHETNPGEMKTVDTEIVILAVGFGREDGRGDLMTYWEQAPYDSVPHDTLRFLVSGYGDGGLTDLMRLCIDGFRHDEFVQKHEEDPTLATRLRQLLSADEKESVGTVFQELMSELPAASLISRGQLATKKAVVFNAPADYLEHEGSSILNRFLVFQLDKLEAFTRQDGKMRLTPEPKDRKYTVEFLNDKDEVIKTEVFDRLIIRHGPKRPINEESFPEIWTATEVLRARWAGQSQSNDRTRVQIWDPADYDPKKAPNPIVPKEELQPNVDLRCVVVESTKVRRLNELESLVRTAFSSNNDSIAFNITQQTDAVITPDFKRIKINEALSGQKEFNSALSLLCRADVAVIDVTNYEPGVMLLLGIRSAVRRGVTLVTTNSKLDSSEWSRLPFNLKELYPVSLFSDDADITREEHLKREVGDAIARAFGQYHSVPFYQDVPAYEAVRRVDPPLEEGAQQQILWLCSFDPRYAKHGHAVYVQNGYLATFGAKRKETNKGEESEGKVNNEPKYLLTRIIDVVSPRLVTQKLYSAIRTTPLCLVDWTFWSANVFFELGVRLAVSNLGPICLLATNAVEISTFKDADGKPLERVVTKEELEQRQALKKLFQPLEYGQQGREQELFGDIRERYTAMQNHLASKTEGQIPPAFGAFPFDHTHNFVGRLLRLQDEPGASDAHNFLSTAANSLIGSGPSEPVLPVLFSGVNDDLDNQVRLAGKEMLLAAWYYLNNRYRDECRQPGHLQDEFRDLGIRLVNLLRLSGDPKDLEVRKLINGEIRGLSRGKQEQSDE